MNVLIKYSVLSYVCLNLYVILFCYKNIYELMTFVNFITMGIFIVVFGLTLVFGDTSSVLLKVHWTKLINFYKLYEGRYFKINYIQETFKSMLINFRAFVIKSWRLFIKRRSLLRLVLLILKLPICKTQVILYKYLSQYHTSSNNDKNVCRIVRIDSLLLMKNNYLLRKY